MREPRQPTAAHRAEGQDKACRAAAGGLEGEGGIVRALLQRCSGAEQERGRANEVKHFLHASDGECESMAYVSLAQLASATGKKRVRDLDRHGYPLLHCHTLSIPYSYRSAFHSEGDGMT